MKKLLVLLTIIPTLAYSAVTFPINGGTGTSTKPTLGQVLVGQANGTYAPQATSTLGITGGGGISFAYGSSTYYFASNPSGYITSSSLSSYIPFSYASTTFPTFSYGSSTYYLASNPSSYITLGSLSATIPIRYNSGTGAFTTDLSTSTTNVWTGLNTFNGGAVINNATATSFSWTSATGTNLKLTNGTIDSATSTSINTTNLNASNSTSTNERATNISFANGTSTNFGFTNLTTTGILGQFLATDLTGKVIASSSPGGTTYSGTLPIRVSGSVISTDFATSTINTYTGLNTFNGGAVINNATATSFGFTSATGTSLFSTVGSYTNMAFTNATGSTLTVTGTASFRAPSLANTTVLFVGIDGSPFRMSIDSYNGNSNFGSHIQFRNASSTSASPTFTGAWTTIGSLAGATYTGSNFSTSSVVSISMQSAGQQTNNSNPTGIFFYTTATGSTAMSERVKIQANGTLVSTSSIFTNATTTNATTTSLNVSGNTSLANASATSFTVTGTVGSTYDPLTVSSSTGNLLIVAKTGMTVNGGDVPTTATSTGIGTGASNFTLVGRQNGGFIWVRSGTSPVANGLIATITNPTSCPTRLVPIIQNATTTQVTGVFATSTAVNTWQLRTTTALSATTIYSWNYITFCF